MSRPKGREKNQIFRLCILDYYLKQRNAWYSREDLLRLCNEGLRDYELIGEDEAVCRRTVDMDLEFMGYAKKGRQPKEKSLADFFHVEFEEKWVYDDAAGKQKRAIRYKDPDFSIFERKLSSEEKDLLLSVMGTMGSFRGIPGFDRLKRLEEKLSDGVLAPRTPFFRAIVDFGFAPTPAGKLNPLVFFTFIQEKKPCRIILSPFAPVKVKRIVISPYQIRQYNGSWFLVALDHSKGAIRSFAVNWIGSVHEAEEEMYHSCSDQIEKRFEDVVGVTVVDTTPISRFLLAARPERARYILANPFHHTLTLEEDDAALRGRYPQVPSDWVFLRMSCKVNQELYTKLLSYGNQLIVLEPRRVAGEMRNKVAKMLDLYSK